jgi:CspA family cold shock protein
MNTKSTLAALGPAALLAAVSFVIETSRMPSWALVFTTALLSSFLTLIVLNIKPKAASSKPAKNNPNAGNSSNAGSSKIVGGSGKKETGSVKWFNAIKGFGFITRANGEEIFVHFRSIVGQRSLRDGQRVEFAVTNGSKGLQAEDVVPLK